MTDTKDVVTVTRRRFAKENTVVNRGTLSAIVVLAALLVLRPAFAQPAAPADAPPAPAAISVPASPPALQTSDGKAARIGGQVLLITGAAALLAGTIMAIHYKQAIGACDASGCTQQDVRAPLGAGIGIAGAMMAMVGASLWLSVPATNARVGLGPSSLIVAGHF